MNWDAIGAVGEIVGALAVVISLIYLATQIRTSNGAVRQASMQEIQNQIAKWQQELFSSEELWNIWIKGNANDQSLSKEELGRFRLMLLQLVQNKNTE